MNMLTPDRPQTRGTSSMSPNSCLVQVEKWRAADAFEAALTGKEAAPEPVA